MELQKLAVQLLACPACKALAGQPCRSRTGRKLTDHGRQCHDQRPQPLYDVRNDALDVAEELSSHWRRRYAAARDELAQLRATLAELAKGAQ